MKKLILVFVAALMVASTAFAGKRSGFEIGYAFSNISYVNKNDSQKHVDVGGSGFEVGYYAELIPFLGLQTNLFFTFPDVIKATNGNQIQDLTNSYNTPLFMFSAEAIAMLNIPITIVDLRVGAGIAYTLNSEEKKTGYNKTTKLYNNYLSVPVSFAAVVRAGVVGIKAGCDIQFVFDHWYDNNESSNVLDYKDIIIALPYVSATINF